MSLPADNASHQAEHRHNSLSPVKNGRPIDFGLATDLRSRCPLRALFQDEALSVSVGFGAFMRLRFSPNPGSFAENFGFKQFTPKGQSLAD
ncbi:hypothetical protein [Sedimentitalea sp. HM32M-2]|uniref:hypothetical protein n=1 Tax=Sedimentitalea sp. HM32M-2 TaxID=3351566 RepID=UPI0036D3848E